MPFSSAVRHRDRRPTARPRSPRARWRPWATRPFFPSRRTRSAGCSRIRACWRAPLPSCASISVFPGVRDFHHVDVRGVEQPLGVLLQPEDGRALDRVVGAHALEYRQPVVQRVGQDVGGGIAPGHEFPVVPDLPVAVRHRHAELLPYKKRHSSEACTASSPGRRRPGNARNRDLTSCPVFGHWLLAGPLVMNYPNLAAGAAPGPDHPATPCPDGDSRNANPAAAPRAARSRPWLSAWQGGHRPDRTPTNCGCARRC